MVLDYWYIWQVVVQPGPFSRMYCFWRSEKGRVLTGAAAQPRAMYCSWCGRERLASGTRFPAGSCPAVLRCPRSSCTTGPPIALPPAVVQFGPTPPRHKPQRCSCALVIRRSDRTGCAFPCDTSNPRLIPPSTSRRPRTAPPAAAWRLRGRWCTRRAWWGCGGGQVGHRARGARGAARGRVAQWYGVLPVCWSRLSTEQLW